MAERLDTVAAVGSAIDAELYDELVYVLTKSAWRNSDENTGDKTQAARDECFPWPPPNDTVALVGTFAGEPVSGAWGYLETWDYPGLNGEYLGYLGKRALSLTLIGVRIPYRGLGFGTQTLAAAAHVAVVQGCSLLSMAWADFQWSWLQGRGGFEGKYGLIAESVRNIPMHLPGFDPESCEVRT